MVIKFIDSSGKKKFIYSIVIFYPFISFLIGAPLPFPSLLDVTPDQIAIFNFLSLLITILGSIVGVGFYLERRQNLKLEAHNQRIKDIELKIDKAVALTHEDNRELSGEMKEMETRLCNTIVTKNTDIEKSVENKINAVKELVDTRFKGVDDVTKGIQKSIDFIQQFQFGSGAKSIPPYILGHVESQHHRDKPGEGIYHNPDSTKTTETQDHKEDGQQQYDYDYNEKSDLKTRRKREKASKDRWDNNQALKEKEENK